MPANNRQQLLTVIAITAVGLFAADKLLLDPLIAGWKARSERIAHLKQQVTAGKNLVGRERSIRNHWDQMRRNALTNDTSVAEQQLFRALDSWEQDSRVIITARTPQWKSTDEYMTYECRIDAAGDLSSLSRFLYNVEKDPLALKLESVELSARDKDGRQLSLGLQISGLVLNSSTQ